RFYNIYVRDRTAPGHTVLISRGGPAGDNVESGANGDSVHPSISADGRYVAFDTVASNIPGLTGDTTANNIVICDRDPEGDGVFDKRRPDGSMDYRYTTLGRMDLQFGDRQWANIHPSISSDGTTVAWQQAPPFLGSSATGSTIVVANLTKDGQGLLTPPPETAYIDVPIPNPNESFTDAGPPKLSSDGRHVVFTARYLAPTSATFAASPAPPPNGTVLYVDDLPGLSPVEVDVDSTGQPLGGLPADPTVSGDGRLIAFTRTDNTTEFPVPQVVLLDRDPNRTGQLGPGGGFPVSESVASRDAAGAPGQGTAPALSSDGRYLAFATTAPNMSDGVDGVEGQPAQVVERDVVLDARRAAASLPRLPAELVSPSALTDCGSIPPDATCSGQANSTAPAVDANGGAVAFVSAAKDLVPNDPSGSQFDVFARQFLPTITASAVDFGTVPFGGTATATVTVSHVGFGPVDIGALGFVGQNAGDFSIFPTQNCQGTVLFETDTCVIGVRFAPSGPGSRGATLQVGAATPLAVPLTGGVGPPVSGFQASPNPLVFPGQRPALTQSPAEVITVTNTSAAPFTITAVTPVSGPGLFPDDYVIIADSCLGIAVPPGGVCTLVVVNVPHGAGPRPGAIAFTDNTGGSPQLVGLTAVATTPTVAVRPAAAPGGRVVTVTGQGFPTNYPVTVTTPSLPGSATVTVNTTGAGTFSVGLPLFQHAEVGTWQVRATAVATTVSAAAPLLVVLGTYQPPDFTVRH
ncbi:MAG TPA: choice-of-anchor D domain-containing protein, partial [Pseudonocardiaceae bacterium]